jgi:hypothetical protein
VSRFGKLAAAAAVVAAVGVGTSSAAYAAPAPQAASQQAAFEKDVVTFSQVCTVIAQDATIRQSPGGAVLATTYSGYPFRVDDFRDNVWVFGAGYRPNGTLIAYGYILRSTLSC